MLTWCSSAGNICWADWLGCLFDSSSISYPLHVKGDHQWFILFTAAPRNVNAFIISSCYGKVIKVFTSHCCVFVWILRRLFYCSTFFFFSKWQIKITVIKSQHGVSVRAPKHPSPPSIYTLYILILSCSSIAPSLTPSLLFFASGV